MLSPSGIMARQAWIVVLDAARRVAQRGNNRQDIFFGEIAGNRGEIGDSHEWHLIKGLSVSVSVWAFFEEVSW